MIECRCHSVVLNVVDVLFHGITSSMTKVNPQKIGGFADAIRFVMCQFKGYKFDLTISRGDVWNRILLKRHVN